MKRFDIDRMDAIWYEWTFDVGLPPIEPIIISTSKFETSEFVLE